MSPSDEASQAAPPGWWEGRRMRLLFLVILVGTVNWVAWWIVTAFMGGDPLGVRPSEQGFVVTERGATEPVSEHLWVVLVLYTWVSQLLFPINVLGLACLISAIFGPFRPSPGGVRSGGVEWFFVIWASVMTFTVTAKALTSLSDWLRMHP